MKTVAALALHQAFSSQIFANLKSSLFPNSANPRGMVRSNNRRHAADEAEGSRDSARRRQSSSILLSRFIFDPLLFLTIILVSG
jgi:hypothetical protein